MLVKGQNNNGNGGNNNNNNNSQRTNNNGNGHGNGGGGGGGGGNYYGGGYFGGVGGGGSGSGGGGGGRRPPRNNYNRHNDPSYQIFEDEEDNDDDDDDDDCKRSHSHSYSHRSNLNVNAKTFLESIKEEKHRKYTANGTTLTFPQEMGYEILNVLMEQLNQEVDSKSLDGIEKKLNTAAIVVASIRNGNASNHSLKTTKKKQHHHHQPTVNGPTTTTTTHNFKKKRKRKASDFMLSYDPMPKYAAKQNFNIAGKLTKDIMPQIIHEKIIDCYEYIDKTIGLQQYDKNIYNMGEVCIVNLDLHLKDNLNEPLYLISRMIVDTEKNRNFRWKTDGKLFTQREIKEKNISKNDLPKSSRESKDFNNVQNIKRKIEDSLTKITENETKLCSQFFKQKWNKLPVFNKHENKLRVTISITKEIFVEKLKYFIHEQENNGIKLNLIPIIMFNNTKQNKERYEIHYVHIIRIIDNIKNIASDIGISYQYLSKQDRIIATGIHLDDNILRKQHELFHPQHMYECKCFDGFESNITHFECGNCDEAQNKIKTLTKTVEDYKEQINTLKSINKIINKDDQYGNYEMTPSRTSPSNSSSYLYTSVSMTATLSNSVENNVIYPSYSTYTKYNKSSGTSSLNISNHNNNGLRFEKF